MDPLKQLADDLYREKVLRARKQAPGDKLIGGIKLFAQVKERMCEGIRDQFPDADEAEVKRILRHRLRIARVLENHPWMK